MVCGGGRGGGNRGGGGFAGGARGTGQKRQFDPNFNGWGGAVPDEVEKMIEKLNFEKIKDRNDDAVEVKANLEHVNRIIGINNQRLNEIRDLSLAKIIVEDRKAGILLQLVNQ